MSRAQLPLTLAPVHELAELALKAPALPSIAVNPANLYLANLAPGSSRSTMRNGLRRVVELIAPQFSEVHGDDAPVRFPWAELRYEHMLVLREMMRERYKRRSANLYLQAVRGVLTQALEQGTLSGDQYQRMRSVKRIAGEEVKAGRALEGGELRALVGALPEREAGARDAAMLALLYGGGARRAEVLALDVSDYDGAAVKVLGKGNKERLVPLPAGAVAAVDGWLEVRAAGGLPAESGPLLVPVLKGGRMVNRPMSASGLTKRVRYLAKLAGVERFSPHDLRRSFATDSFRLGIDGGLIQRLMGHVRYETTLGYDHRGAEDAAEAVKRIAFPYRRRDD